MSKFKKIVKESRYWHFRINDLTNEQYNKIINSEYDWIRVGEIEPGRVDINNKHYHVAIKFKKAIPLSTVKGRLLLNKDLHQDKWYLGAKYGDATILDFINYTIKNGCRFEKGINKKELIENKKLDDEIKNDKIDINKERKYRASIGDLAWFDENDSSFMFTSTFNRMLVWAQPNKTEVLKSFRGDFIYGTTGTGKSSSINYLFPDCYRKIKNNEKWDSYFNLKDAHKVVYFDELDDLDTLEKCCGGFEGLKTMAEVYPFAVRQNYGNRELMIRPERIIITSNYTPSQIFSQENRYGKKMNNMETKLKQFYRKFKVWHISEWQKHNNIVFDTINQRTYSTEDYYELEQNRM